MPLQLRIENDAHIQGLDQTSYTDRFNEYLHRTLDAIRDEVNVVFSPTALQASKSAKLYSNYRLDKRDEILDSLGSYFRESVHPQYQLANIVQSGVTYHTGKTPMHVRKSVEYLAEKKCKARGRSFMLSLSVDIQGYFLIKNSKQADFLNDE